MLQTARQGYGLSRGELDEDVLGVAAPIRDTADRVVAAVSVAAVATRVPDARLAEVVALVQGAAADITSALALVS